MNSPAANKERERQRRYYQRLRDAVLAFTVILGGAPGTRLASFSVEREADARLIAKAPEMLAMLASCLAYFDNMRNGRYAAAAPDAAWTAPIRALLRDIEGRP